MNIGHHSPYRSLQECAPNIQNRMESERLRSRKAKLWERHFIGYVRHQDNCDHNRSDAFLAR